MNPENVSMSWTEFEIRTDIGEIEGPLHCGVCHSLMNVDRKRCTATSMAAALANIKSKYDSFCCPHYKENWHRQVVAIRHLADNTPSAKLNDILREEANDIVCTREATLTTGYT